MLSIACKNDNFASLHFSNYLPLSILFNSFSEHNFAAVSNILMVLGRITETGQRKVSHTRMTTLLVFIFIMSPDP